MGCEAIKLELPGEVRLLRALPPGEVRLPFPLGEAGRDTVPPSVCPAAAGGERELALPRGERGEDRGGPGRAEDFEPEKSGPILPAVGELGSLEMGLAPDGGRGGAGMADL